MTDGFYYEPMRVYGLKPNTKNPGLSALSNLSTLKNHRSIVPKQIEGVDWNNFFQKKESSEITFEEKSIIEKSVEEHSNLFWEKYESPTRLSYEHKWVNTAKRIIYYKKGY